MEITATELKTNLGKYLTAAAEEDIVITKNGKVIARLMGPPGAARPAVREDEYSAEEYKAWSDNLARLMVAESGGAAYDASEPGDAPADTRWELIFDGKAVAKLTPLKKKRKLGFIKIGPVSAETEAALFEPTVEPEVLDRWENEKW
jgi:antitoxin (DNA-binding transcriptional repressor) of toxin-antitoxin stability system